MHSFVSPVVCVFSVLAAVSCSSGEEANSVGSGGASNATGGSGNTGAGGPDSGSGGGGQDATPGCSAETCASGSCEADGDCEPCIADDECEGGRLCSTGVCTEACSTGDDCTAGSSCCGDRCADLAVDALHCGACDTVCGAQEFCGGTCKPALVTSACDVAKVTFLLDGLSGDDEVTAEVRDAWATTCTSAAELTVVQQDSSGVINPTTGQPVAGSGQLVVVLGGPYGQKLVKYLEQEGVTRVYNSYDTQARFHLRGEGGSADTLIIAAPVEDLTLSYGFFLVESVVDPASRTWTIEIYGVSEASTRAAAWWFSNHMLPDPAAWAQRYYVYEWTDNGDSTAGDGDTFELLTSGN